MVLKYSGSGNSGGGTNIEFSHLIVLSVGNWFIIEMLTDCCHQPILQFVSICAMEKINKKQKQIMFFIHLFIYFMFIFFLVSSYWFWFYFFFISRTSHRTLLRLHNLRAVILILICLTSVCEIGSTYLLVAYTNDNILLKGLMPYVRESACFFFISIITTAVLLRAIEVRKGKSGKYIMFYIFNWKNHQIQN